MFFQLTKMNLTLCCLASLVFQACASTPVTSNHWQRCEDICQAKGGIKEACVEPFKGEGCHCNNDQIIWLQEVSSPDSASEDHK
ncbi:MAG: hypothetical protein ACOH5I_07580 [Oligoflexus sp.]